MNNDKQLKIFRRAFDLCVRCGHFIKKDYWEGKCCACYMIEKWGEPILIEPFNLAKGS